MAKILLFWILPPYLCQGHDSWGKFSNQWLNKVVGLPNQAWVCLHVHNKANLLTSGCGEGKCSVCCRAPSKESRQLVLRRPNHPESFQGKVFKDRIREGWCGVCDQLMDILLIGWWWGNQESTSSTFWFQPVWGLRACGQQTVNFFHLVGVSVSAKQLKGHGSEYYL